LVTFGCDVVLGGAGGGGAGGGGNGNGGVGCGGVGCGGAGGVGGTGVDGAGVGEGSGGGAGKGGVAVGGVGVDGGGGGAGGGGGGGGGGSFGIGFGGSCAGGACTGVGVAAGAGTGAGASARIEACAVPWNTIATEVSGGTSGGCGTGRPSSSNSANTMCTPSEMAAPRRSPRVMAGSGPSSASDHPGWGSSRLARRSAHRVPSTGLRSARGWSGRRRH
jgi:hypothetical protein